MTRCRRPREIPQISGDSPSPSGDFPDLRFYPAAQPTRQPRVVQDAPARLEHRHYGARPGAPRTSPTYLGKKLVNLQEIFVERFGFSRPVLRALHVAAHDRDLRLLQE